MPEMGLSGLEGGARFKPSFLPLSLKPGKSMDCSSVMAIIPRPRGRGPVEAMTKRSVFVFFSYIPRPRGRGPVET